MIFVRHVVPGTLLARAARGPKHPFIAFPYFKQRRLKKKWAREINEILEALFFGEYSVGEAMYELRQAKQRFLAAGGIE